MATGILYNSEGTVTFDVVESEQLTLSSSVSDNAVEDGDSVVDNVRVEPEGLKITAHLTGSNAKTMHRRLMDFWQNKTISTFAHKNAISSVVIETLSSTSDASNKNGYKLDITLKKIKRATLKTTTVLTAAIATQAKEEDDAGREQKDDQEVDEEVSSSWLAKMYDKVAGWF